MSNQGQQEQITIRDGIKRGIIEAMESDPSVIVLGEDVAGGAGTAEYDAVGSWGGVFGVTGGLVERFGRDRVLDTPLAETALMGTAIGAAMGGLRPIVEIMFADFLGVCFEPILNQGSRVRYISGGQVKVPLVVRAPYGAGLCAGSQHSGTYYSLFAHLPGVKVVVPSNPHDAKGLLTSAIRDPDPVLFFEPKRVYRAAKGEVPEGEVVVPIGKARVTREGAHVTVIAWGAMWHEADQAVREAAALGIDAELLDLRTLQPLDVDAIAGSVCKTGRAVVVHEAPRTCGFGAEISALIQERCFLHLEAPVTRVTGFDTPFPYTLENEYLPRAPRILKAIREVVAF